MIDYSKHQNPYDFSHPVREKELFAGRNQELEHITYYLDQATINMQTVNIAIIGNRACGKTSLLNITEIEAKDRGFCTVRIKLDEGDTESILQFFFKIFDLIFSNACKEGAFNGKDAETYEAYFNMVHTFEIPGEKKFCPFIFPFQYAMAMSKGNLNVPLSEQSFEEDLQTIYSELKKPIILLFDECDVLTKNKVFLQKLRNIFQNMNGYMLVFAETPNLFPLMDDVFSPIIRQFKKISLGDFQNENETRSCLERPLKKIGIRSEDIFDYETLNDIKSLHELAGKRPYEIQLICHVMFRRVQTKVSNKMKLDVAVIEEVRRELEDRHDINSRKIYRAIKTLDGESLRSLEVLCRNSGHATSEQLWHLEYAFNGEDRWSKDCLEKCKNCLVEQKVLLEEDGIVTINGDEFDKIYLKYYAREQNVRLFSIGESIEDSWSTELLITLIKKDHHFFSFDDFDKNIVAEISQRLTDENDTTDVFTHYPYDTILGVSSFIIRNHANSDCYYVFVNISTSYLNLSMGFYPLDDNTNALNDIELQECFHDISNRVNEIGGNMHYELIKMPTVPFDLIIKKLKNSGNHKLRDNLEHICLAAIVRSYEYANREEILAKIEALPNVFSTASIDENNCLGYIYMVNRKTEDAESKFADAIKECYSMDKTIADFNDSMKHQVALITYNFGMTKAMKHEYDEAINAIDEVICILQQIENEEPCICLWYPKHDNGELIFDEFDENPLLSQTAFAAKETLNEFCKDSSI